MKKIILSFFSLTALILPISCNQSSDLIKIMNGETLDSIVGDVKEREKYLVIDVREEYEYEAGHLEHSINISVNDLEKRINEISDFKEKNVVVICRSGRRSRLAAQILVDKGFKKVFDAPGVTKYNYKNIIK